MLGEADEVLSVRVSLFMVSTSNVTVKVSHYDHRKASLIRFYDKLCQEDIKVFRGTVLAWCIRFY